MNSRQTSIKRIGFIMTLGIVIGIPVVLLTTHGVERASFMARELQIEMRASVPFTVTAKRLREYRMNRNTWESLGFTTYDYEFTAHCFCLNAGRHIVKVTNGEVSAVVDADTNTMVHASNLRFYDTIERQFEIVRDIIRHGADKFDVEYDPETGIPIRTKYDYRSEVIDDEGWNTIRLLSRGGRDAT